MTDCPDTSTISSYVAGDLEGQGALLLDQHVSGCDTCAEKVSAESALWADVLEGTPQDPGSAFWGDFSSAVLTALDEEVPQKVDVDLVAPPVERASWFPMPMVQVGALLASAFAVLVMFWTSTGEIDYPSDAGITSVATLDLQQLTVDEDYWEEDLYGSDFSDEVGALLVGSLSQGEVAVLDYDDSSEELSIEDLNDEQVMLLVASLDQVISG